MVWASKCYFCHSSNRDFAHHQQNSLLGKKSRQTGFLEYRKSATQMLTHHSWDTTATQSVILWRPSQLGYSTFSRLTVPATIYIHLFMEMTRPGPLPWSQTLNFLIACHHKSTWDSNFRKNEKLLKINMWQRTRKKKENNICPSNVELCSQVNKRDGVQWRKAAEVSSWWQLNELEVNASENNMRRGRGKLWQKRIPNELRLSE